MRGLAAAGFLAAAAVLATPALAEVCDKIEPRWNSEDGRVTVGQEFLWSVTSPTFLALTAAAIVAVWFRSRLAASAVAVAALMLGFVWAFGDSEIMPLAVGEGCVTGQPIELAAYVGLAIATGLAAWLAGGRPKPT